MLDPSDKMLCYSDDGSRGSSPEGDSPQKKTCADCGTSKTPLWRGGPAGPKSLCNACGIRSRKRRREMVGLSKSSSTAAAGKKLGLKSRFVALGREVMMQRPKQRRKMGEVEQAAVLLMALSYGSVFG